METITNEIARRPVITSYRKLICRPARCRLGITVSNIKSSRLPCVRLAQTQFAVKDYTRRPRPRYDSTRSASTRSASRSGTRNSGAVDKMNLKRIMGDACIGAAPTLC
jgi:hypothetical protein